MPRSLLQDNDWLSSVCTDLQAAPHLAGTEHQASFRSEDIVRGENTVEDHLLLGVEHDHSTVVGHDGGSGDVPHQPGLAVDKRDRDGTLDRINFLEGQSVDGKEGGDIERPCLR